MNTKAPARQYLSRIIEISDGRSQCVTRWISRVFVVWLVALVLLSLTPIRRLAAAEVALSPEAEAVRRYILEKEYLEVFGDVHYRVRVQNLVIADLDNDGQNDVILHVQPHYRQSATILVFKISKDLTVKRVAEGLAPGPLRPLSGDYLDSHETGNAVDFSVPSDSDTHNRDTVIATTLKQSANIVAYRNFFHMDARAGMGSYIDMTNVSGASADKTCNDFEFSTVRELAVGHLSGQERNVLAAWVGEEIWVYSIERVRQDGLLEKKRWIVKAPPAFSGFLPNDGLAFKNSTGRREILSVDTGSE